jgi:hypothetical protein
VVLFNYVVCRFCARRAQKDKRLKYEVPLCRLSWGSPEPVEGPDEGKAKTAFGTRPRKTKSIIAAFTPLPHAATFD